MPSHMRSSGNSGTNDAEGNTDSSYMTDSNASNDYYSDIEMEAEESDSDSAVRNAHPKPIRRHSVGIDRQAGQPLGPYSGYPQPHGSSTQVPPVRQHGPNQGPVPGFSANRYPDQNVNYAFGSGGRENIPLPGSWGPSSHSYGGYPAGYSTGYPTGYPTGSQYYPPGALPMHLTPPPPPPQEAPAVAPEAAPEADRDKAQLEAQLAVLTAQRERDEKENRLRQELEGTVRQLEEQLEKARQESSRETERARLQGERDARQKIEEERHAELEKKRQLAKQRIEIESEVKIKLEAEKLAQIVREETQRRQLEEFKREALESVLDRLDDAMTLSQEKLLGDTEMEKEPATTLTTKPGRELLLAEMKSSIASRLRQSLVVSEPEQNNSHTSLRGRGSRSRLRSRGRSRLGSVSSSRSRSPRHQVECISVPDSSSSRSPNSSFDGIGPGDWTGDLPHVPDAPRNAYESEEESDDLSNHSGYDDYGDDDSVPRYPPQQYHSRRRYERGMNADYQDNDQRQFEALIHHVTDAVMDRLRVPNWDAPIHTAPYDRHWDQCYPHLRRKPSKISDYSDLFDERPSCGDVTDIHDDTLRHKVSRPYKPRHLRGQPIRAVRNTPPPSPGTSLNPLPFSIVGESNVPEEGHVRAQTSVFPTLLENNNSTERDTGSGSDSASTTDSDSTIFHEASESMTEYSTSQESTEPQDSRKGFSAGGKDETSGVEEIGRFGSQMKLWKKMPES
ncbi:hypothetical protein FALCPG4_005375 [Fusarium falciforme]